MSLGTGLVPEMPKKISSPVPKDAGFLSTGLPELATNLAGVTP